MDAWTWPKCAVDICRKLVPHATRPADSRAPAIAGSKMAISTVIIATTTNNSSNVKDF